jgi:hypothetical protein
MVAHVYNPHYSVGRRIEVQGQPGQKYKALSEKETKNSKGWQNGSRGRVPAFARQGPVSTPSTAKKEKVLCSTSHIEINRILAPRHRKVHVQKQMSFLGAPVTKELKQGEASHPSLISVRLQDRTL